MEYTLDGVLRDMAEMLEEVPDLEGAFREIEALTDSDDDLDAYATTMHMMVHRVEQATENGNPMLFAAGAVMYWAIGRKGEEIDAARRIAGKVIEKTVREAAVEKLTREAANGGLHRPEVMN